MDFVLTDVFHLFTIARAAAANQPLTPSERAWLKAYKGMGHAVLAAVLLFLYQFFAAHQTLAGVNWQVELSGVALLVFKAYLDARGKFFSAQASSAPPAPLAAPVPAQSVIAAPVAAPAPPTLPAPSPAPLDGSTALGTAPLSGGDDEPAMYRMPTNPMLKNVPLPYARRQARDVH